MKRERVEEIKVAGNPTTWEARELASDWLHLSTKVDEAQVRVLELEQELEAVKEDRDDWKAESTDLRAEERRAAWVASRAAVLGSENPIYSMGWADKLLAEYDARFPVEVRHE